MRFPVEGERGEQPGVLILVENLPSPFDRRVWQEAGALRDAGYRVSIICPTGAGCEKRFEVIDGIHLWRYTLPTEAEGALGYVLEYGAALAKSFALSLEVLYKRGFSVVHACNPPDLFFLIGGFYKLFGKRFVFDHHDACPELFLAKFPDGKWHHRLLHRLLLLLERWTFATADLSIATNESYRRIALERGRMLPGRVFVVRSGPSLERMKLLPPDPALRKGRRHLVGYLGVMGRQEGIDLLLEAVQHLVQRLGREDIQFALVGGGTSLKEMKALAARLGVADYVTSTGRVPDAEMLSVLNTAQVCVNPDVANAMNDISTMNKVMEYMALGKPLVQFDLIEGRRSARGASLYARRNDPADLARCIAELLDDPARARRMGESGRQRVLQQLEWRHEAPRLIAAYAALEPTGSMAGTRREKMPL